VLSGNGTIVEQGTFEKLRKCDNGHVKDLIFHEDLPWPEVPETNFPMDQALARPQTDPDDINRQDGDTKVYLYFANSVGWIYSALFMCTVILYTFSSEFQAVLLDLWSASETKQSGIYTNTFMGLYGMLSLLALCGIGGLLCVSLLFAGPHASINLHQILLRAVFAAPYSWFVATDSGVTLNR
jgi:ATP-binding cassette subfamily C (CFTR/MRP) protein 1